MPEHYFRFRRLSRALVVITLEGRGLECDPCRLVYHVHTSDGELIGEIDTLPPPIPDHALNALRVAEQALADLGACDDSDCQEPNCLHALVTVRRALGEKP